MRPFSAYLTAIKSECISAKFNLAGTTPPRPKAFSTTAFDLREAPYSPVYPRVLRRLEALLGVRPGEVTLAPGCTQALTLTLAALTVPGDRVLIEKPTYEPFLATAQFLGLKIKRFQRTGDIRRDLPEIRRKGRGAKVILIANPGCPTGHIYSAKELRQISALGPRLIVDEIYLPLSDRRRLTQLASTKAIHISGLSKSTGLSSARVGWIRAPRRIIKSIDAMATLFQIEMPTPSLCVADVALARWDRILDPLLQAIEQNRATAGTSNAGSFILLPVPKGYSSGHAFAKALARKSVWVRAGEFFECPKTIRISLLIPPANFTKAWKIIAEFYA